MSSKTTLWRHRKFGTPTDGRGRNSNELRGERLAFVGAVVAQLIETGEATCHGLKVYPRREPSARELKLKRQLFGTADTLGAMDAGDTAETMRLYGELQTEFLRDAGTDAAPIEWRRPSDDVWQKIQAFTGNADCLALATADALTDCGHLVYRVRSAKLRGEYHSDLKPRRNVALVAADGDDSHPLASGRNAPKTKPWRLLEGMSRKTLSYWKVQREGDFSAAKIWLGRLLKRHGGLAIVTSNASGILRDDLADALAGKKLRLPKTATLAR